MSLMADSLGRPLRSLRISVTDKCNLRCQYCMPEEDYIWLERNQLLSYEEIAAIADVFTGLGVDKIRLTGGEPLLRRDLRVLIRLLRRNRRIRDLALTTNAVHLSQCAGMLKEAGLHRLTVSLDSLRPDRFRALTRRDNLSQVLEGIQAARQARFNSLKINTVVVRGFNDDELGNMVEFGRGLGAEVRFIEYMDVGGATRWSIKQVVSRREMLDILERHYGPVRPLPESASAPADRYILSDGTIFGIISSMTQPFCGACDRARLTSDGMWFLCLYAHRGLDLKRLLRSGASPEEMAATIRRAWQSRSHRGAEQRLTTGSHGVLYQIDDLKEDPHREMHTRGG